MRKLILIAGFALASAAAQAGEPRSLSLASEAPAVAAPAPAAPVAETPKTAETATPAEAPPAAETPKYTERPALVDTKSEPAKAEQPKAAQSNVDPAKPVAEKTASASKQDKSRRKRYWTESRIIGELHRHGIYW